MTKTLIERFESIVKIFKALGLELTVGKRVTN